MAELDEPVELDGVVRDPPVDDDRAGVDGVDVPVDDDRAGDVLAVDDRAGVDDAVDDDRIVLAVDDRVGVVDPLKVATAGPVKKNGMDESYSLRYFGEVDDPPSNGK
jgi:hypothetical protein